MSDAYVYLELGLQRLIERLGPIHPDLLDALGLEARLRENIAHARYDGDTEVRRADRAQIIRGLNQLALVSIQVSFNELCRLVPEVVASEEPALHDAMPVTKQEQQISGQKPQANRKSKANQGKLLKLHSGCKIRVKTPNMFQFLKIGRDFPEREPWSGTDNDRLSYETWMRKVLPFISCNIDEEALAQRRVEAEALGTPLPKEDKLAYIAYVCIDHIDDLKQIAEALIPPVQKP